MTLALLACFNAEIAWANSQALNDSSPSTILIKIEKSTADTSEKWVVTTLNYASQNAGFC